MKTLALLKQLIERPSMTPQDKGCQDIIAERLRAMEFQIVRLPFGDIDNLWAYHGTGEPSIIFVGHTDVVPPGDHAAWHTPPFVPTEQDGYLYGRGAADMKSGLSAMVVGVEEFIARHPDHAGTIGFMITSDEEGVAEQGTKKIVDYLTAENVPLNYAIVGEASSCKQLGDVMKIGRRGSMYGHLTILGKQGHIAYPDLADNPIHHSFLACQALIREPWDTGNAFFPPTSLQLYSMHSDAGASNIIPGQLDLKFNFRFSPIYEAADLQRRCEAILDKFPLNYTLKWKITSQPFLSGYGKLATVCEQAVHHFCGIKSEPKTDGGTSDGRFLAEVGCEVVELGPINATAHQVNECVAIADLQRLTDIYQHSLELLLCPN